MTPRETENNAYVKFWGNKQIALWYVMVFSGVVNLLLLVVPFLLQFFPRGGRSSRQMGMCHWMRSHFHDWIDYYGVAFLKELLEWGRTFSGVWRSENSGI